MPPHIPLRYNLGKSRHTKLALDDGRGDQYRFGMNALRHFRAKAGLTQQALADAVGTSQPQILRLEGAKRKLTKEWAVRLAPHVGVSAETLLFPSDNLEDDPGAHDGSGWVLEGEDGIDVPGEVAAGRYLTVDTAVDASIYDRAPIIPAPEYPRAAQFGLIVRGTSINQIALDGDTLHCVDIALSGLMPVNGDLVIVEQIQFAGQLIERTAKVFHEGDNEAIELRSDSDDQRWQTPIFIPNRTMDWRPREDLQISIKAVVIGTYKPRQRQARRRK